MRELFGHQSLSPKFGSGTHFETRCPGYVEPIETIDGSQKLDKNRDDRDRELLNVPCSEF
jgi:hypothetical protein